MENMLVLFTCCYRHCALLHSSYELSVCPLLQRWHIHLLLICLKKWNRREIHDAVQHLGRPNKLFADAVDSRQVISVSTPTFEFVVGVSYSCVATINWTKILLNAQSDIHENILPHVSINTVALYCYWNWINLKEAKMLVHFVPAYIILIKWICSCLRLLTLEKLIQIIINFVQEIDLRIGASFTRFQTMLLRDAFVLDVTGDDRNVILSYGPCQVLHYRVWTMNRRYWMCAHLSFRSKIFF